MTKKKRFVTAGLAAAMLALIGMAGNAVAAEPFVLGVQSSGGTTPFCYNGWTLKIVPDLQCYNRCMNTFINCKIMHPEAAAACQAAYNGCHSSCGNIIVRVPCENDARRPEPDPLPW